MDEQAILSRLQDLDEEALVEVYRTFQPPLYRYAYRLLGHVETAEDVVAETFYRLLRTLKQGHCPRPYLQAWLYRVAHNLVVDLYRRQPKKRPLSLEESYLAQDRGLEETVQRRQEQERVRQALFRLTPAQQQVVALKFLEELSNEQVAGILGKPVGAVKSLQHRALAALRRILDRSG